MTDLFVKKRLFQAFIAVSGSSSAGKGCIFFLENVLIPFALEKGVAAGFLLYVVVGIE